MKKLIVLLLLAIGPFVSKSQLTVSGGLTPQQLVQNVLLGSGITAFNITFTGDPVAIGTFNGVNSNIGLDSGIIMTSGDISQAAGANTLQGAGLANGAPGDADLDFINSTTTQNACVLEFDFVPASSNIKFNFVFGSEEYNEFVNSSFNDVFAFLLSGPGIIGQQNLALVPGTTLPVAINNVNNGNAFGQSNGPCTNCSYFFDNTNGTTAQYDAFTTVLTAYAIVNPCDTFHIKLAVADAVDQILDSGVLLEAASFTGGVPLISATFASQYALNDSSIIEGCTDVTVRFSYPDTVAVDTYIKLAYAGTATNGVDYNQLPDSVKISAGDSTIFISIYPVSDALAEGVETIEISQTNLPPCLVAPAPLVVKIRDKTPFTAYVSNDTTICAGNTVNLQAFITSGQQPYTISWDNGVSTDSIYTVSPTQTTTYNVSITDACGQPFTQSITVSVLPNGPILTLSDTTICPGSSVLLMANVGQGAAPLTFNWNNGAATTQFYQVTPSSTTTYTVTVTDACQQSSTGTITVNVQSAGPQISIVPGDTTICPGASLLLTVNTNLGVPPFSYTWNNGLPSANNVTVTPSTATTYSVTVTDACSQTTNATVTVSISSTPSLSISPGDTAVCEGTQLTLIPTVSNAAGNVQYNWDNGQATSSAYTVTVNSNVVIPLTVTDACGSTASQTVNITANKAPTGTLASLDTICNNREAPFTFTGTAAANANYIWQFTGASAVTGSGSGIHQATWNVAGTYPYTLIVDDGSCPKLTITGEIDVVGCEIEIPNIFTPNGDNFNELFFIKGLESFPNTRVEIYNRWGNLIYETDNYKNDWRATDAPDGVYYYIVIPTSDKVYNGTVTIMRK